jgi:antitoxin (DNA-binding transcriptional repressor) of toxin-antitoxin stability system
MTITADVNAGQLAELVKQVQAGHDVLIMQGDHAVARMVPPASESPAPATPLMVRSLKGHRVLTPTISQSELADELFVRS